MLVKPESGQVEISSSYLRKDCGMVKIRVYLRVIRALKHNCSAIITSVVNYPVAWIWVIWSQRWTRSGVHFQGITVRNMLCIWQIRPTGFAPHCISALMQEVTWLSLAWLSGRSSIPFNLKK